MIKKIKLKRYTKNQYRNNIDSYNYTYWQNKKFKMNKKIEKNLPEAKRLAIYLYSKLYKTNPSEMNKWIDESPNFINNWDGEVHKKYLDMALELLSSYDYETIVEMYSDRKTRKSCSSCLHK